MADKPQGGFLGSSGWGGVGGTPQAGSGSGGTLQPAGPVQQTPGTVSPGGTTVAAAQASQQRLAEPVEKAPEQRVAAAQPVEQKPSAGNLYHGAPVILSGVEGGYFVEGPDGGTWVKGHHVFEEQVRPFESKVLTKEGKVESRYSVETKLGIFQVKENKPAVVVTHPVVDVGTNLQVGVQREVYLPSTGEVLARGEREMFARAPGRAESAAPRVPASVMQPISPLGAGAAGLKYKDLIAPATSEANFQALSGKEFNVEGVGNPFEKGRKGEFYDWLSGRQSAFKVAREAEAAKSARLEASGRSMFGAGGPAFEIRSEDIIGPQGYPVAQKAYLTPMKLGRAAGEKFVPTYATVLPGFREVELMNESGKGPVETGLIWGQKFAVAVPEGLLLGAQAPFEMVLHPRETAEAIAKDVASPAGGIKSFLTPSGLGRTVGMLAVGRFVPEAARVKVPGVERVVKASDVTTYGKDVVRVVEKDLAGKPVSYGFELGRVVREFKVAGLKVGEQQRVFAGSTETVGRVSAGGSVDVLTRFGEKAAFVEQTPVKVVNANVLARMGVGVKDAVTVELSKGGFFDPKTGKYTPFKGAALAVEAKAPARVSVGDVSSVEKAVGRVAAIPATLPSTIEKSFAVASSGFKAEQTAAFGEIAREGLVRPGVRVAGTGEQVLFPRRAALGEKGLFEVSGEQLDREVVLTKKVPGMELQGYSPIERVRGVTREVAGGIPERTGFLSRFKSRMPVSVGGITGKVKGRILDISKEGAILGVPERAVGLKGVAGVSDVFPEKFAPELAKRKPSRPFEAVKESIQRKLGMKVESEAERGARLGVEKAKGEKIAAQRASIEKEFGGRVPGIGKLWEPAKETFESFREKSRSSAEIVKSARAEPLSLGNIFGRMKLKIKGMEEAFAKSGKESRGGRPFEAEPGATALGFTKEQAKARVARLGSSGYSNEKGVGFPKVKAEEVKGPEVDASGFSKKAAERNRAFREQAKLDIATGDLFQIGEKIVPPLSRKERKQFVASKARSAETLKRIRSRQAEAASGTRMVEEEAPQVLRGPSALASEARASLGEFKMEVPASRGLSLLRQRGVATQAGKARTSISSRLSERMQPETKTRASGMVSSRLAGSIGERVAARPALEFRASSAIRSQGKMAERSQLRSSERVSERVASRLSERVAVRAMARTLAGPRPGYPSTPSPRTPPVFVPSSVKGVKREKKASRFRFPKAPSVKLGARSMYADLLSVGQTELKYGVGKALHPSLRKRPGLWAREGSMRVPTAQQLGARYIRRRR